MALEDEELLSWERRLRGLVEPAMRRERLLCALECLDPEEGYALLSAVLARPGAPTPHLRMLREVLQDVLRGGGAVREVPPALRESWLRWAEQEGDAFVARLLRASGAAQVMDVPDAALPRDVAELPLGVRRSLARGVDLRLLEKLLLDPDPVVLGHLLRNARITEPHVIGIAARRPIAGSVLRAIAKSPRFGVRPRVRTALARNPYCPSELALQLIGALPTPELGEIAEDPTLDCEIREHAAEEMHRRCRT